MARTLSKSHYVAPLVGTGTFSDPYRADVPSEGIDGWHAIIPTDEDPESLTYGQPVYDWCLVEVDAVDHAGVTAREGWIALPNSESRSLVPGDNGKINQIAARCGIDLSAATTTDELIEMIGKGLAPTFPGRHVLDEQEQARQLTAQQKIIAERVARRAREAEGFNPPEDEVEIAGAEKP
jgi:hypothetical protein